MNRLWTPSTRPLAVLSVLIVVLWMYGASALDGFGGMNTVRALLLLAAILGFASAGQTLVLIMGGIDLSVPFLIGFGNVATAQLYGNGIPFGIVVLLVVLPAALVGAAHGALAAKYNIHPLILTLGTGTAMLGFVQWRTGGFPAGSAPHWLSTAVSTGSNSGPLPVPPLVTAWAVLAVVLVYLERRTSYGRRLYAVGTNPSAAAYAGLNRVRLWSGTFALSAALSTVTGIFLLGFTGSAFGSVGEPYLFLSVAAVVVGGTLVTGGRGTYIGSVLGAILLTLLRIVLTGVGVDGEVRELIFGAVLVILVALYGRQLHVRSTI